MDASDGFYKKPNAVGFAAMKGDTLAVVIRGIVDKWDLPGMITAAANSNGHYQDLLPFIKEAINYANGLKNSQGVQIIHKILITGSSLGGQAADLFAADPSNATQAVLGRFTTPDVSIITFGSTGIPEDKSKTGSPLLKRVLDLYNSSDPVYNHSGLAAPLNGAVGIPKFVHTYGIQKPLYTPNMNGNGDVFFPHYVDTYNAEIGRLDNSKLSSFADSQTALIFGGDYSSLSPDGEVLDLTQIDKRYPISTATPQFVLGGDGNSDIIGSAGNDLIDGGKGTNTIFGGRGNDIIAGGSGTDHFMFVRPVTGENLSTAGSDTILGFSPQENDYIAVPHDTNVAALIASAKSSSIGHGIVSTVLTHSGGTLTLNGVSPASLSSSWFLVWPVS